MFKKCLADDKNADRSPMAKNNLTFSLTITEDKASLSQNKERGSKYTEDQSVRTIHYLSAKVDENPVSGNYEISWI